MISRNFLLILLLIFSFGIRVWDLNKNPAGFYVDEAMVGFNAYKIVHTGRDSFGDLPLFFKGYGTDSVSPYSIYFTVPFVWALGPSEFAVRLPAVFGTVLAVLFFYLLLREFLPKNFSLIGAFLFSIIPWTFHLGRIVFGDFYAWILLSTIALYFVMRALRTGKYPEIFLGSVFFGLSSYGYFASRMINPILFLICFLVMCLAKSIKKGLFMLLVFSFVMIPFLNYHLTNKNSFKRMQDTVEVESGSIFLKRFIYKYSIHFSDDFLFYKGDAGYPGEKCERHSIIGLGLLYPYQKIFIIFGIIYLFWLLIFKREKRVLVILGLLFIFPAADSLTTRPEPYATRSYIGALPLSILSAFGIYLLYRCIKGRLMKILFFSIILILCSLSILTLFDKFGKYKAYDYEGFQYGPREIVNYFKEVEGGYDELFMAGRFDSPQMSINFYAGESCKKCFAGGIEKFRYGARQLFSLPKEDLDRVWVKDLKKIIYYPDGKEAYYIVEISGLKQDHIIN